MSYTISNNGTSPNNFLKSIIDSAFIGIMAFRSIRNAKNEIVDFQWIFANKVASEIVDYPVSKLVGSNLLDLLPGNFDTGLFDQYKEVVESGNILKTEQFYKADNMELWFRISASKLGDGFTVTFQDISEYKKAQAEIETKGKKYQKLFDESIDAIYLLDDRLRFLNVNSSLLGLFGYDITQLKSHSIQHLFLAKADFSSFKNKLENNGKIEELEVTLKTRDNLKRFCLINSVSIYDEERTQLNYLGVIRDMTKRKQAERDILVAEKLSMTGKIARTIGHEVRNPLTNLSLALEQLKEELPEDLQDVDLYLNILERNSNRIEKLISDLLQSSKPKALKLVKQPIVKLINSTLELIRDRMNLRDMQLIEEYPANKVDIMIDSDQLKIALLNLLINAIEAMKPGLGVLQVICTADDEKVQIVIEDNGSGIDPEDMKHLFEPYFTGKQEGTGLGLTTVQNIIHSHKGTIHVESELGRGTTFIIEFARIP